MKNIEVENKIKHAFKKATPDILDRVLSDCENQKGTIMVMTENKKTSQRFKRAATIAAAFAILLCSGVGFQIYSTNYNVASVVSLDVNPSIEIKVNQKEHVLEVNPLNDDGKKVVGNMDFKGSSLEVTVNALIGSMLKNGYISDISNSILLSVDSSNPSKGVQLEERLTNEINMLFETEAFQGAILSQTVSSDNTLQKLADKYNITLGKAQLIQEIVAKNSLYTADTLAPLSVNELNLLAESQTGKLANINSTGTASDKGYIGIEKAKSAALAHAGVSASNAVITDAKLDTEHGVMVYEVEFRAGGYEYDYDINAASGAVVKSDKEWDDDYHASTTNPTANPGSSSGSNVNGTSSGHNTNGHNESNSPASSGNTSSGSVIGEAKAKEAALAHAGVSASNILDYDIELDTEQGISVYEIEFKANGYEYSYDINAASGKIIKSDKELDD